MRTARLARALTKHANTFGIPIMIVVLLYIIPALVLLVTGWLWELFIVSIALHLWLRAKFRKDEYWLDNSLDAPREGSYLEP